MALINKHKSFTTTQHAGAALINRPVVTTTIVSERTYVKSLVLRLALHAAGTSDLVITLNGERFAISGLYTDVIGAFSDFLGARNVPVGTDSGVTTRVSTNSTEVIIMIHDALLTDLSIGIRNTYAAVESTVKIFLEANLWTLEEI